MGFGFPDDFGRRAGEFLGLNVRRPVAFAHDRGVERITGKFLRCDVAVGRAVGIERRMLGHDELGIEGLRPGFGRITVHGRGRYLRCAGFVGVPALEFGT